MNIKKAILILIGALILIPAVIFIFPSGSKSTKKPQTIANLSIDHSSLKPVGDKIHIPTQTNDKGLMTITFTNTSGKTLSKLRLRLEEVQTTDPTNFQVVRGPNTGAFYRTPGDDKSITFLIPDAPAHSTLTVHLYIWARHTGSSLFLAKILTGGSTAIETNTLPVKAE